MTARGANVAVEVTGLGKGLDRVLDCMRKFGRVALLGCTRNSDFTIDHYRKVHGPGITPVGAHTAARPRRIFAERMRRATMSATEYFTGRSDFTKVTRESLPA
ncbi:MAG: hypothetical protein ACLUSP_10635 [Christensenellales bacterium]